MKGCAFPHNSLPFLRNDPPRREAQDVEPAVADQAVVSGRGDGQARVEEGGVFHGVAIEALGAELEHNAAGCCILVEVMGRDKSWTSYALWE